MILWFTIAQIALAVIVGLVCIGLGLAGRRPGDVSVGAMALLQLALIAQIVVAIVAPFVGNSPTGSALVTAAVLPLAGIIWAFIDRGRWSVVVMGVLALAVAVMTYREWVIWTVQLA
jgi:hypothetical protein